MMQSGEPTTIKRYGGCRLYDPILAIYITLDDLTAMVEGSEDFVVRDAETGEDVTRSVLTQIIVKRGAHG